MIFLELLMFLLVAYLLGLLMKHLKLPSIIGYLVSGILVGQLYRFNNWDMNLLKHIYLITKIALATILLKAGFGISKPVLKKVGTRVVLLAVVPNLLEGFTIGLVSMYLLDITLIEGLMLGFIISAVSPAVIIPSMLRIQGEGYGVKSGFTTMNLASASIDDVVSITMFSFLLNLYLKDRLSIGEFFIQPLMIINGIIIAVLMYNLYTIIFKAAKNKYIELLQYSLLISGIIFIAYFGSTLLINASIAVIVFSFILNDKKPEMTKYLNKYVSYMWYVVSILLFFTIGARINLDLPINIWGLGLVIIIVGLTMRLLGSYLCLIKSRFVQNERILNVMCNIPKATVQASLAAIPLVEGVKAGEMILAIGALSILITAPIGSILIEKYYKKLLTK